MSGSDLGRGALLYSLTLLGTERVFGGICPHRVSHGTVGLPRRSKTGLIPKKKLIPANWPRARAFMFTQQAFVVRDLLKPSEFSWSNISGCFSGGGEGIRRSSRGRLLVARGRSGQGLESGGPPLQEELAHR